MRFATAMAAEVSEWGWQSTEINPGFWSCRGFYKMGACPVQSVQPDAEPDTHGLGPVNLIE